MIYLPKSIHLQPVLLTILCYIIIPLLGSELFFRYYYYRWNAGLSVPFVMFARPFPHSYDITNFITVSKTEGVIFELLPNIRSRFLNKMFYTNSQGFIGKTEYTKLKPDNTFRIVGIGDSMMSSWGVDPNDTYLSALQRKLSSRYPEKNIEAINMSVPGYNTAIEYEVIKSKALPYNPDLIILEYCGNDLDLPNHIRRQIDATSYLYFVIRTVIGMIYAGNNVGKLYSTSPLENSPKAKNNETRFAYTPGEVPKKYAYMVGAENYLVTMNKIFNLTKASNVPVLLLLQDYDILYKAPDIRHIGFNILNMNSILDSYLPDHGMKLTDITVSKEDYHFNKIGHELYANFLLDYFINTNVIDKIQH